MKIFRPILAKPTFWPLFGAMSLGAFNDNCFRQAMIAGLAFGSLSLGGGELSDETKSLLGSLAMSLLILPFFLFSSLAGQLADRYSKTWLVKIAKGVELAIMLMAAYFFYLGQIIPLMIALFCMGSQSAFFGPLKYGLLPEILDKKELLAGNGLVSGATFLAITLGAIGGSYLAGLAGDSTSDQIALVLPITLAVVSALGFLFAIKQPPSLTGEKTLKIDPQLWRSTYAIIKSVRGHSDIWRPILAISWFWSMGSVVLTQLPVLASSALGATPAVNAFLITMFSVGVALGSLLTHHLNQGHVSANLAPLAALMMTVFMAGLAYSAAHLPPALTNSVTLTVFLQQWPYLRLAICCFLVSVSGGLFVSPLNALIQHRAAPERRARVIAANNIMNSLFIVVGSLLVMGLVKWGASLPQVFMVVALSALVVTIISFYSLPQATLLTMARLVLLLVYRPQIRGIEHLDNDDKVIIIPNHRSFLDVAMLAAFLPRRLTFAIDANWAQVWWVKIFTRFYKTIPINPAAPMSIRKLINEVNTADGERVLVIFPEGRITTTGSIMKIHDGPGLIASKCDVPVVPIIFEGLEHTRFGRMRKILRSPPRHFPLSMTVFPPQRLEREPRPEEKRQDFRRRLTSSIYDLLTRATFQARDYQQNLWLALLKAAHVFGSNRVIIEDFQRAPLSYAGFIRQARVLGRRLAKITKPGEKVGVLLPNAIPLAATLFGLWAGGRIPVILNYSQGRGHLKSAKATAKLKTLITSKNFLKAAGLHWSVTDLDLKTVTLEDLNITLMDKLAGLCWSGSPAPADSLATVVFTSGSEGQPKGVALSHQNLLANIHQATSVVEINSDDIMFNAMPCFHAFGLNIGLLLPLLLGLRSFNYVNPLRVKIIPELVYDTRATIIIGSDSFANAWARDAHPYDFRQIRFAMLGAEKVQARTMERYFHQLNLRLYEGYGITEGSPVLAVNTPMRVRDGSVGQLLPGVEYRLEPTPGLAGGRFLVKGPNIMMGYLNPENPGQIEPPLDGWHDTGDLVDIDAEGFVWIKGRFKRFAKISGEMISLTMVEEIVALTWPNYKSAILSQPDELKGEKLLLVTTNPTPALDVLRQVIRSKGLTDLSAPKQFLVVPEIPRAPSGKVDLPSLTKMVDELGAPPRPPKANRAGN
ncbi:MAG: MFS transporter [Deltaproteobacteria bacterium]|jgi:acyl-[acyl-carrier-protein]-phospholipid O-acyltransferase/long-chain-fatty-acid--[acyl-carrier-protein] ligase|nr:MFS transporter [Deltaproteobacteria bacterium]